MKDWLNDELIELEARSLFMMFLIDERLSLILERDIREIKILPMLIGRNMIRCLSLWEVELDLKI
jgi:hypothetical protein